MKKKFLGILLSLSLIVSLVPASVFAYEPFAIIGDLNGDATVDTKDVDLLQKFLEGEKTLNEEQIELADINGDGTINDKDLAALIAVISGASPEAEEITLTIPYKTTVVQAGNVKPGKTTFNLELVDSIGDSLGVGDEGSFENVEVKASVTTNGAGNYSAKMTITGSVDQLEDLLGEGAYVRQIDAGKKGWKYDDAVWALFMEKNSGNEDGEIAEMAVSEGTDADGAAGYSAVIYPTTYEDKEYSIVWTPSDMSFENVYDVSTDVEYDGAAGGDSDKDSGSDADKSAKTGDDTNLTLLFALLGLSAAGLVGTGVYGRRKVDSHMK